MEARRELLRLMGELLEYPGSDIVEKARRCESLLRPMRPGAEDCLAEFIAFAESEGSSGLEELYTATFDLNPQCYPYAGYQLFGEDPKRSELMAGLQHAFGLTGFEVGSELPDHVPVLLRYLAEPGDEEGHRDLAGMVLVPALEKMAAVLESKENLYAKMVAAALSVMSDEC